MGGLGNGDTLNIVESLTKHYPTSLVVSPEMRHLKDDWCPGFLIQLSSRVITISHMDGDAPFPCTSHWGVQYLDLLLVLEGIDEPYYWLSAIFLTGPR